MNEQSQGTKGQRTITLQQYDVVAKQVQKVKEKLPKTAAALDKLLKDVKSFVDNYKIQCQFRLAIKNSGDNADGGIELGKIKLPATLATYVTDKLDMQDSEKKPTMNQLLGVLLKHRKFNVAMASKLVRVKFPQGAELDK
jgi:hypothetical protein